MKTFIYIFLLGLLFLQSCTVDPVSENNTNPIIDEDNSTDVVDLDKLTPKNLTKAQIDSLMNLLIERTENMLNLVTG